MPLEITSGVQKSYTKAVIYGVEGIGKSTLASKLAKPLFADVEGGTNQLPIDRVNPKTYSEVLQLIANLKADQAGYKTFVIDTADWMERIATKHVINDAGDKIKSIEDFGFGKGWVKVKETMAKLLDKLNELPMDIVLLAHAELKKFELPQEQGSYDRYSLKLSKKGSALIKEWADTVLFANYKTLVEKEDPGNAKSNKAKAHGQKRMLYTTHHASWDAKNRFGLKDELPLDIKSIAAIFGQMDGVAPAKEIAKSVTKTIQETTSKNIKEAVKKAEVTTKVESSDKVAELENLMALAGVHHEAVEAFVVKVGACPAGTSYKDFNEATLNKLINEWDVLVLEMDEAAQAEAEVKVESPLTKLLDLSGLQAIHLEKEVEAKKMGSGPYSEYPEALVQTITNNWAMVVQSIKGE